jgi:uncharacterized delta-60 repeat protein
MKIPLAKLITEVSRGVAMTVAIASGVMAPLAMGASGELDPSFGEGGRIGPIVDLAGPAWSVEIQNGEGIVFAGGDFDLVCGPTGFCDLGNLEYAAAGHIARLTASGLLDLSFAAPDLVDIQVHDIALQSDGKIIAVGRYIPPRSGHGLRLQSRLIVFRLQRNGSLDQTFGGGILENLPLPAATHGTHQVGTSVLVDSNGRIVVGGIRSNEGLDERVVLRLLSDGSFDQTFGDAGLFIMPTAAIGSGFFSDATSILQTAIGGYRLAPSDHLNSETCQILALTEGGTVDDTFGNAGLASVVTSIGDPVTCNRMVAQVDGRLVVMGFESVEGQMFVTRLLANGEPDPGFAAGDELDALSDATALAVDLDGRIVIGGIIADSSDAVVMRLQANGALDQSFGNAGTTVIDLPTDRPSLPVIRDMILDQDNRLVAAGGAYRPYPEMWFPSGLGSDHPFLFRLFGENSNAGPGVIGVAQADVEASEPDQVVVNVRRTGGKTGSVSVAYATVPGAEAPATGGEDYAEIAGRLTWDDGDTSEHQIVVQVFDNGGAVEEAEQFRIALSDAQGGASLGTRSATISIRADGGPNGQFSIVIVDPTVSESDSATVRVQRNYYYEGAVSVTLTPVAGTATAGDDFIAEPVTLFWADNDVDAQTVGIALNDDAVQEGSESFTVELSNSTMRRRHRHRRRRRIAGVEERRDFCRFCSLGSRRS